MLDSMAGMAAAMGSGGHGQQSAPPDSDSASDLDGGTGVRRGVLCGDARGEVGGCAGRVGSATFAM